MEDVLANEVTELGGKNIHKLTRAVSFEGDKKTLYQSNIQLRTALRLLVPLTNFRFLNQQDFYKRIFDINWPDCFPVSKKLAIDVSLNSEVFSNSLFVAQRTKDAIVDRFRKEKGKRPSVDTAHPEIQVNIHIDGNICDVSLDSSGESLHKRGYRNGQHIAPINECLAAGLILMTGYNGSTHFIDPMCGSGTFVIEAGLIALKRAPNRLRQSFSFCHWNDFDKDMFDKVRNLPDGHNEEDMETIISGSDISSQYLQLARESVIKAELDGLIRISKAAFDEKKPPSGKGILVMNPPYGERILPDDIIALYKEIGDVFKHLYKGYSCWLITSNAEALKSIGLKPEKKIKVYNGSLECRFVKFDVFEGSRSLYKEKMGKLKSDNNPESASDEEL